MDWIQVVTVIITLGGVVAWFKKSSDKHIDRIDNDLRNIATRLEFDTRENTRRIDYLNQRMDQKFDRMDQKFDQMHQVIIDMLKIQQKS